MTLEIFIGSSAEIEARLASPPDSTTTVVESAASLSELELEGASSFFEGGSIVINRQKRIIMEISGNFIQLNEPLLELPAVGDVVRHYDASYTDYRAHDMPLTFVDDLKTGGATGDSSGLRELSFVDRDSDLPPPSPGNRITIFDTVDPAEPLFAGVIVQAKESYFAKQRDGSFATTQTVYALGYQWEADAVGIEEEPFVNVNAGAYLKYLLAKYTTLFEGEIDTTNSPVIDFIRVGNYRRFTEIGQALANFWPGSEFFIKNTHTGGQVFFRQRVATAAPIVLNDAYISKLGANNVTIVQDHTRTFNKVRLPFYRLQRREPDFFVQDTVSDNAFLRTSVILRGQPANVEESILLFDDFSSSDLLPEWTEDDLENPAPPPGFTDSQGYLVAGDINDVPGLHLLDTSTHSPAVEFGDIGRVTNPAVAEPFTGAERQIIFIKELVVNSPGDAVIGGIIDQTTYNATAGSGATTTSIPLSDADKFQVGDRITVNSQKAFITNKVGSTLTVSPALSGAPQSGDMVSLHRLALSRIKFGIIFKANGDLKYLKNGQEYAFNTPRTYDTDPTTYSIRIFTQSFEATVSGGVSADGCTLSDATNFATGDVVDIYTQGSRKDPERRVIAVDGSDISYQPTEHLPTAGYRVKTLPKITVQIKGGDYGDILGRDWTTIHTESNTWQALATEAPEEHGILLCLHKSLVGTVSFFQMKDPIGITANIGARYLHIGAQEIDSSEKDVDCIVRKLGNHYQLDFFPDTKALWGSGTRLECRYDEKFRFELEESDLESMKKIAQLRGFTLTGGENEENLTRRGGLAMDTIAPLPNPISLAEAISQNASILDAVKDPAVSVEILTNSVLDGICRAGQTIRSEIPGLADLEIKQVRITETMGAKASDGQGYYTQFIVAGSVDRLSEILFQREIQNGARLVLNDGNNDDSFTKIQKVGFQETAQGEDLFADFSCLEPTVYLATSDGATLLMCLRIPVQ